MLARLSGDALGTVGVIASFRPDGPTVGALGAAHPLTVLEPLDRSAAGRFLSATRGRRLGDPEVDRMYRQSGGMPLALLHAGDGGDGPAAEPSVTATLSTWLAARPMDAQRALGVAAVLADGTRFDLAVAASLLADEPGTLAALGVELDAAVAVRRVEGMGAFTHRAWRDVAYANVEAHRRRGLHRRVLELLERRVSGSSDPVELAAVAAAIAHHAELADSRGLATTIGVGALVRAADNLGPYETTTALSLYATALEIARPEERLAILLRQGRLRRLSAQWNEAEEDLRAAVEAAEVLGDLVAETEATLLMAHMTWDPQRWGGTLEDRLASLVERMPPDEISLRARLQACLAGGTYQDGATGAGPESGALARAAADVVDRLEPGDAAEVLMWARKGLLDLEPPERTLAMAASMRRLAGGSTYLTANALLASVVDNIRLGADDAARADSDAYRALAASTASPVQHYVAATLDALWALYDGRFGDVEAAVATADELGIEFGGVTARQVVMGQRVILVREQSDACAIRTFTDRLDARRPADGRIPIWNVAIAWMRAAGGQLAEAGERLRSVAEQFGDMRDVPRGPHRIVTLAFAAETLWCLTRAGLATERDRRLAGVVTEALAAHPDRNVLLGWPAAHLGPTARYVGLGAAAAGQDDMAVNALRQALDQCTSPPHRSRLETELSALLTAPNGF